MANATAPATSGNGNPNDGTKVVLEILMAKATKHTLTLNLPDQLRDAIKASAAKRDLPDNAVAREILASHYGMKILDNATARSVFLPGLTKEQKAEVRNTENTAKRQRAAAITDAILSGTLPQEVLEKYGLSHLIPLSTAQIAANVLANATAKANAAAATAAASA